MPVNYTVKATVVDIRGDTPRATDKFYVDTNAWFWTVYSNVQHSPEPPRQYQATAYPNYLKQALNMGAKLHWCGLSLSELAHNIEHTEFLIFRNRNPGTLVQELKEYRHRLTAERANVVNEIKTAWGTVESMSSCVSIPEINQASTTAALQQIQQFPLDAYDSFSVNAFTAAGIDQVITDDGDFCTIPGIKLFTANTPVIDAAKAQGRFRRR